MPVDAKPAETCPKCGGDLYPATCDMYDRPPGLRCPAYPYCSVCAEEARKAAAARESAPAAQPTPSGDLPECSGVVPRVPVVHWAGSANCRPQHGDNTHFSTRREGVTCRACLGMMEYEQRSAKLPGACGVEPKGAKGAPWPKPRGKVEEHIVYNEREGADYPTDPEAEACHEAIGVGCGWVPHERADAMARAGMDAEAELTQRAMVERKQSSQPAALRKNGAETFTAAPLTEADLLAAGWERMVNDSGMSTTAPMWRLPGDPPVWAWPVESALAIERLCRKREKAAREDAIDWRGRLNSEVLNVAREQGYRAGMDQAARPAIAPPVLKAAHAEPPPPCDHPSTFDCYPERCVKCGANLSEPEAPDAIPATYTGETVKPACTHVEPGEFCARCYTGETR